MQISFSFDTTFEPVEIKIDTFGGYPIVRFGNVTWFPTRAQLVELRDKADAYLTATPDTRQEIETAAADVDDVKCPF